MKQEKKNSYVYDGELINRLRIPGSDTPNGYGFDSLLVTEAWTKNLDSFMNLPISKDRLRLERSFYEILKRYHNMLTTDMSDKIERRIKILLDSIEPEEDVDAPDIDSFEALVDFVSSNPRLKMPSIFLDPAGKFDASWRQAADKLVSLRFQNGKEISWLLFVPWEEDEEGTSEATGRCAPDDFLQHTSGFGVRTWMETKPNEPTGQ
jgi:hypothetical protein